MTRLNKTQIAAAAAEAAEAQAFARAEADHMIAKQNLFDAMGMNIVWSKRTIISIVASVATYALGAIAGLHLAAWLSAAAYSLTGVMFISMVLELMVAVMCIVAAMVAGGYVARYISTGQIIDDMASVKSWAARKFSSTSLFVKSHMVH